MAGPVTERPKLTSAPSATRITDFDQLVQLFAQWEGRFEQLSCGRFEAMLKMARGRQIHAHLATANQAISVHGREGPSRCTFTLILPESGKCTWQKRQLDPGSIVVRDGDVEVDHRTSKVATNLSFTVPDQTIHAAVRILERADPETIGWQVLKPAPELYAKLENHIRQLLYAAAMPPLRARKMPGNWSKSVSGWLFPRYSLWPARIEWTSHALLESNSCAVPRN